MPVELAFDQSIGKLFVARVAGNIATPAIIASLEYGAAILGIKVLVVLGHADRGAIKAAAANAGAPGQISALYPYIRPAINASSSTDITEMARQNAINQGAAAALGLARPGKTVRRRRVADPAGALRRRRWTGQLFWVASSMLAGRTGGGHLLAATALAWFPA